MPIQPKDPSCQAISIHVSIISWNDGSTPPAAFGLNADIRPLTHISSTIGPESVRKRSDSAASARTRSRIPRARSTTRSRTSVMSAALSPKRVGSPRGWGEPPPHRSVSIRRRRTSRRHPFGPLLCFIEDHDRLASLISWRNNWRIAWRPCLYLFLCLGLCLRLCFFPCLKGVIVIVFVAGVVVRFEDDLVPPLVGLYPRFDVTSWSCAPELDVL